MMETQEKRRRIGLYFGTFNPVHMGHLVIANHMATHTDLEEVWMVVTLESAKGRGGVDGSRAPVANGAFGHCGE
jgi:cytidyltransferase-like protein